MKVFPDKSRGQNFLVDKNILQKIIAAAELKPSDTIIEIGAGQGILTAELAKHAKRVIAFEIDKKLISLLKEKFESFENVEIIEGDILKNIKILNIKYSIFNYKVVANIPYNITSAVLEKFLSAENKPSLLVLMVQREVAERICACPHRYAKRCGRAKPGEMSLLSVMVQYYGQPEIVARVPATAFWPTPKVESAILKIKIRDKEIKEIDFEKKFFQIVKAGFSHRRKMLKNNLVGARFIAPKTINCCRGEGAINCTPIRVEMILSSLGLSPKVRAEELSIEEWKNIVSLWYNKDNE